MSAALAIELTPNKKAMKSILSDGFDEKSKQARAALLEAITNGSRKEVEKRLLDAPRVWARLFGPSPLVVAARTGNADMVELLIGKFAGFDEDPMGASALFMALEQGDLASARLLLPVSDMEHVDRLGRNALHFAIRAENPAVIDFVVETHGKSLARTPSALDETPLMSAVAFPRKNIVGLLRKLAPISDLEARDKMGRTALMAATKGDEKAVAFLAERCDLGAVDKNGKTAIDLAWGKEKWAAIDAMAPWMSDAQIDALEKRDRYAAKNFPWISARKEAREMRKEVLGGASRAHGTPAISTGRRAPKAL